MLQDGFDDLTILDGTDDPHGSPAYWADERINPIDFLNQPGPAFPAGRRGPVRFDDAWDGGRRGAQGVIATLHLFLSHTI
jgi:hypothetical protein